MKDELANYLARKGLRSSTGIFRVQCLEVLLKVSPTLHIPTIENYLLKKYKEGQKAAYLNQLIFALRAYGECFQKPEYLKIAFFKKQPVHKGTLSIEEINKLISLPPQGFNGNKKQHAKLSFFFKLLAYTGMRPSEVATLTVNQILFGENVIELPVTKTSPRKVPISPAIRDELEFYVASLSTKELFPNLNSQVWQYHFRARLKRLGITRSHITAHSLRHSFIARMIDEEVNLLVIQDIVGHKDPNTTRQYAHLATKQLVKAVSKDSLARENLSYEKRRELLREGIRHLFAIYTHSLEEEKQMLHDLKGL